MVANRQPSRQALTRSHIVERQAFRFDFAVQCVEAFFRPLREYSWSGMSTTTFRVADRFDLTSPYEPAGDQPAAIAKLVEGFRSGKKYQCLLGVTGSGKTFTVA